MKWFAVAGGCVVAAGLVTGCGGRAQAPEGRSPAETAAETRPAASDDGPAASLHQRAARAMAAQRVLSPAGDNAVEHYLAARARGEEAARAQAALVELQPYLLIASEQALLRGDATEAARVLVLIERIDAHAPALPRLREGLARLHREQEERKRAAAETATAPVAVVPLGANVAAAVAGTGTPAPPAARTPTPAPVDAASPPASTSPAAPERATVDAPPVPLPAPARTAQAEASPSRAPSTRPLRPLRLLQDAQPRYPLPALRAQIEGQAEVAFTIQPDGSVRNVQLVSSTPSGLFDASAIAVAQRWRFEATGQSHASRRTVLFRLPAGSDRGG